MEISVTLGNERQHWLQGPRLDYEIESAQTLNRQLHFLVLVLECYRLLCNLPHPRPLPLSEFDQPLVRAADRHPTHWHRSRCQRLISSIDDHHGVHTTSFNHSEIAASPPALRLFTSVGFPVALLQLHPDQTYLAG